MAMAPRGDRISGPTAIRYLLPTASTIYERTVKDTVAVIREVIDAGQLIERETQYARLMLALMSVQRDLGWVVERTQILLGIAMEGDMGQGNDTGRKD